jgi:alpha-D-ribose 1-methylphosphonate 5-triphosphate synthase subunit PhnG
MTIADPRQEARRRRLGVLAQADGEQLARLFAEAGLQAAHHPIRGPETGLVTLRGRTGGGGAPFNLGEATVTRATVQLADGSVGHAVMMGRDHEKARLAAIVDALAGDPAREAQIETRIVAPLAETLRIADARLREETAATRVEFFTMVRGED